MYAIYLRKSRADVEAEKLGEMETLARHEKILTELAKRHDYYVSEIYKEIVSGESIEDRPQMKRLLNDIYQKKYKGVLVMEVERLARGDTRDQGTVAEAFKYSETLIITPMKTYDPNNQYDEEYFEFGLFMSRREYKTIQRRLMTGKLQSVKEGNYIGSIPPYGYDMDNSIRKVHTLKPNEDEAKVVKMIYDFWIDERLSLNGIARKLSKMRILTRTGKREWSLYTVGEILRNEVYIGKIRWQYRPAKKEYVEGSMISERVRRKKEDYSLYDGKHPSLIDEDRFYKAQEFFNKSIPIHDNKKLSNPLSGLLRCKKCGKAMRYRTTRKNRKARIEHSVSHFCKQSSHLADEVINAVIDGLKSHIDDFEFKLSNESERRELERHANVIDTLKSELKKSESALEKLFDYLESGIYTQEEFLIRKEKAIKRIEEIKGELQEEKKRNPIDETNYQDLILKFSNVIESLKRDDIDAKYKNDLLKEIIDHIDYNKEKSGELSLDIFLK